MDIKSEYAFKTFKNLWIDTTKNKIETQYMGKISDLVAYRERGKLKSLSIKEDEFKSSLLGRLLINLGFQSENRKYVFEEYTIMLLMMKELGQSELSIDDFDNIDMVAFYEKYFKANQERLFDTLDSVFYEEDKKKRTELIKDYHRQEREVVPKFFE